MEGCNKVEGGVMGLDMLYIFFLVRYDILVEGLIFFVSRDSIFID